MMWGLLNEGYFSGDFLKTYLGPPFPLFQKLRAFGDLPKIAISWLFGLFEAAFLLQNLLRRLPLKCMLIRE